MSNPHLLLSEATRVSYNSPCGDQIHYQSNVKKEGFVLGKALGGGVSHCCGKIINAAAGHIFICGPETECQGPLHHDPLPPVKLCLLKEPQPLQCPSRGVGVQTHESMGDISHSNHRS